MFKNSSFSQVDRNKIESLDSWARLINSSGIFVKNQGGIRGINVPMKEQKGISKPEGFSLNTQRSRETKMLLIPEKTAVPSQAARITRPRLRALLESNLVRCASTIVSGRAGTGKTAVAIDFAQTCGRPVAWYKLDASDNELPVFLRYLVSSIAQQRPGFGEQTLAGLTHPLADYPTAPADSFVYELLEYDGNPLLIVIEDLHLVCEGEWLVPFLCGLLPLLPRKVHILITSRTLPPAPLWRMRSKQTLEVIDETMLAFTPQEALELFETYGLSAQLASAAYDRSRGRAGLLTAYAIALSTSGKVEANDFDELNSNSFPDRGEPCESIL